MENAPASDFVELSCSKILKRTIQEIPRLISGNYSPALTRVGPLDMVSKKFRIISPESVRSLGSGRTNANSIGAFLKDNRLYIAGSDDNMYFGALKYITAEGVVANPEALADFVDSNGDPMFDPSTSRCPIDYKLFTAMKVEIVNVHFPLVKTATEDEINDSNNQEEQGSS